MPKFEVVPLEQLKTRVPGKLLPLVEEFKGNLEKLKTDQGGKITLEKGDEAKDIRAALKAAAVSMKKRVRYPFRGEEGAVSFYLVGLQGRRGRPRKEGAAAASAAKPGAKKRGRPRKVAS
jgi:hypothetical protein